MHRARTKNPVHRGDLTSGMPIVTEEEVAKARNIMVQAIVQDVLRSGYSQTGSEFQTTIGEAALHSLRMCQNRVGEFLKELVDTKTSAETILKLNTSMEDYLMQSFRQRNVQLEEKEGYKGLVPSEWDAHTVVIRKMSHTLTRDLRLQGTMLLDRLLQDDVLSETDRESILAEATQKRKNESFIEYLCANFTTESFVKTVLPALAEEHSEIAEEIVRELHNCENLNRRKCTFCKTTEMVSLRKLAEALFQLGKIPQSLKHDLCSPSVPISTKWEHLLQYVQDHNVMMEALKQKYPHLHRQFILHGHSAVACCCPDTYTCLPEPGDVAVDDVARMSDFDPEVPKDHFYPQRLTVSKTSTQAKFPKKEINLESAAAGWLLECEEEEGADRQSLRTTEQSRQHQTEVAKKRKQVAKKLRQIEALEKKVKAGKHVNEDEGVKLSRKRALQKELEGLGHG